MADKKIRMSKKMIHEMINQKKINYLLFNSWANYVNGSKLESLSSKWLYRECSNNPGLWRLSGNMAKDMTMILLKYKSHTIHSITVQFKLI